MGGTKLRLFGLLALFMLGGLLLVTSMITALVAMAAFADPNPGPPLWNAVGAISFACFPIPGLLGALIWIWVATLLRRDHK